MFLADLLILLAFVWLCRKLFQALKLPSLFGEVFAGVIAGPLILGVVHETEAIHVLAELGIFLLMFHAGLESHPKDLFKASKTAVLVAIGGGALSILGGILASIWFGYDMNAAIFIGMCLAITAVAISTRLFKDNKLMRSKVAHTVMAASVMTEVVILVALSVFLDLQSAGQADLISISLYLFKILGYFATVFIVGHYFFKHLYKIVYKGNKGFTFTIILALAMSVFAELIGLHFIIGAFLAGLFLSRELMDDKVFDKIEDRTFGLSYSFLAPIFFATLAFHLDFTALQTVPLFMLVLLIMAFLGKVVGSGLPALWTGMNRAEAFATGLAMNSRGAVELIVASIGLQAGIINEEIFSVLVLISFATTLISIIGMKPLAHRLKA